MPYPIQPKQISIPGQKVATATQLDVRVTSIQLFEGAVAFAGFLDADDAMLYNCNVPLTPEQYAKWGSDDESFVEAVAENVGAEVIWPDAEPAAPVAKVRSRKSR